MEDSNPFRTPVKNHAAVAIESTPAKRQFLEKMIDENEAIKAKRRDCLVEELGDYGEIEEFDNLLSKLQVENEYKAFKHRFRGIFAAMAFRAIAYVGRTAVQPIITDDVRKAVEAELTSGTDADDSVHAHLRCDSSDHDQDPVLVDVNISKDPTDSSINIHSSNRIERTINPRGLIAHMFRVEYRSECAILKLAWTPVDQLPESAVYDALKAANIPNIPSIIDSGIIIENSFGFRVEYLLIEDCGVPLVEYLQTQMLLGIRKQSDIAASAMFQAVECIYGAWSAGILHRDITADSVVVKGGQARIIDWGHAKFAEDCAVNVESLAAKWLFNKDKATGDEGSTKSIIGTPVYTSIPVLVGAKKRSIADDVESVFYVAIDALYKQHADPPIDGMVGVKFSCSKSLALMRGGCLSDVDFYRQSFGVPYSSEWFTWLTDTFREYLFIRNGKYIGIKLSTQSRFERTVEIQQLENILEQIKERVYGEARSQNAPSNTTPALGNVSDRNAPLATKHTLEETSSQALPVETTGASTSATKRPRKAAADKNAEPLRRSKRIQDKKKR
ncbi:hypothetical protein IW148_006117 [Coemansia sp. RSA 1199]|nr:hypothetical protein IW148_006117 [Coemansia sp. RSA 1199]